MNDLLFILLLLTFLSLLFLITLIPVFKTLVNIYPYAYTNARLRAMRSKLVKSEKFEEYFKRPYNDIVYSLEKDGFSGLAKYLGADFSYSSMDTALRTELIRDLTKVKKISPNKSQKFLSVFLSRYDIDLIKSVVRSTNLKLHNKQDIYHVTEVFSKNFLAKRRINLNELQNELKGSIYQDIINRHYDEIKKKKFILFEQEIDILLYKRLLFYAKSSDARTYVKMLIDAQNVSLILKDKDPLILGGYIPIKDLHKKMSVLEVVEKIKSHGYKINSKDKESVERDLYRRLFITGKKFLSKGPLSESSIIGYIILKTINTRNLNILLKMKFHEFDVKRIKEVIV